MAEEPQGGAQLSRLLAEAKATLKAARIEDPALDARIIVEHFTGTTRIDAISDPRRMIEASDRRGVIAALARRRSGEPVYRILGCREFFGLPFRLSTDTLEPRPDTETLVRLVLPFVVATAAREGLCRILDLGAGTGAIALALLHREPQAVATATDISAGALAMAAANADMLGMGDRYQVLQSDWFDKVEGRFHLIVTNPPYIPSGELSGLQPEVRDHDPALALDGGVDGLDAYRAIARGAACHIEAGGKVAVEIGHRQRRGVSAMFLEGGFRLAGGASDFGGRDRALMFEV